jgi:hypothetical protein
MPYGLVGTNLGERLEEGRERYRPRVSGAGQWTPGGTGYIPDRQREAISRYNFGGRLGNPLAGLLANQALSDEVNRILSGRNTNLQHLTGDLATTVLSPIGPFAAKALPLGFGTSLDILAQQGEMDPRLRNQVISDIDRRTMGNVMNTRQRLAQSGFDPNIGVGGATLAAIEQAGQGQVAGFIAQEARDAEERKRQDLAQLMPMFMDPGLAAAGLATSQDQARRQESSQRRSDNMALLGTALAIGAKLLCWVARAVLGEDNPEWLDVRRYILTKAPASLSTAYLQAGPELADRVRKDPELREQLRPVFEEMARKGREA